jgi:hypothetical protein
MIGSLPAAQALNEVRLQVEAKAGEGHWIGARTLRRSAARRGGVPKAVLEIGAERHAIEVRLSRGTPAQLDELIRKGSRHYDAVVCFGAPAARRQLEHLAAKRDWRS